MLASEFAPARRLLDFARDRLAGWTSWLAAHATWVRAGVGAGVATCTLGAVYGSLVLTGVPEWVPDAVVPPLPGRER